MCSDYNAVDRGLFHLGGAVLSSLLCILTIGPVAGQDAPGFSSEIRLAYNPPDDARVSAWSPRGDIVATASGESIHLWHVATGTILRTLHCEMASEAIAFSPSGSHVLVAGGENVHQFSVDGVGRMTWECGLNVRAVAYSRDEKRIMVGGSKILGEKLEGIVMMWDVPTRFSEKPTRWSAGQGNTVLSVAATGDGNRIAVGGPKGLCEIWCVQAEAERDSTRLIGHTEGVFAEAFSPDSSRLVTASDDGTVRCWSTSTGTQVWEVAVVPIEGEGSSRSLRTVAISRDGKRVAVGGARVIWLAEADTGKEITRFDTPSDSVCFSPDGTRILSSGKEKPTRIWDISSGKVQVTLASETDVVGAVTLAADGNVCATGSPEGFVSIWSLDTGELMKRIGVPLDPDDNLLMSSVASMSMSKDGRRLVTGDRETQVILWNLESGKRIHSSADGAGLFSVPWVAIAPDGTRVVSTEFGYPQLWESDTGTVTFSRDGDELKTYCVNFSPDGRSVLTGGADKTARLFETESGKEIRRFELSGIVYEGVFSHDGRFLALGYSSDGQSAVSVREYNSGREVVRLSLGQSRRRPSLAFLPDNREVAVVADASLSVWDVAKGMKRREMSVEGHAITSVCSCPTKPVALTGCTDGTSRLWNTATGREICRLISFRNGDWAVVAPNDRYDAANGGRIAALRWIKGDDVYHLDTYRNEKYCPGLLRQLLAKESP